MIRLKKILIIILLILFNCNGRIISVNSKVVEGKPVNVAVLFYRFSNEPFVSLLRQNFEEIQNKNEGIVKFTFYDGKNNQSIQDKTIDELLRKGEVDLILLDLVNTKSAQEVINKIKQKNISVVLFHREPFNMDSVRSYNKAFYVGSDPAEAGRLEGGIIVNAWHKDKIVIDRNSDDVMQYVMLIGERDNLDAIGRAKYSVSEINDAEIRTQEIASKICNWDENIAENTMETMFLQQGNKIEVIISNNDSMAIGAIKALQKYGYNKGDKVKTIPVVGVDAIPEAQELIKKGYMTGSVFQDAAAMAEAIYIIGMNLVNDKAPLYATEYKLDETQVAIRIQLKEYV